MPYSRLCPHCERRFALKEVAVDPAAIIRPDRPLAWVCKCGQRRTVFTVKL
jgi:hypothetical protein